LPTCCRLALPDEVPRHVPVPVVLVSRVCAIQWTPKIFSCILVPLDGSMPAAEVLMLRPILQMA
jgi:hypothetical protein